MKSFLCASASQNTKLWRAKKHDYCIFMQHYPPPSDSERERVQFCIRFYFSLQKSLNLIPIRTSLSLSLSFHSHVHCNVLASSKCIVYAHVRRVKIVQWRKIAAGKKRDSIARTDCVCHRWEEPSGKCREGDFFSRSNWDGWKRFSFVIF